MASFVEQNKKNAALRDDVVEALLAKKTLIRSRAATLHQIEQARLLFAEYLLLFRCGDAHLELCERVSGINLVSATVLSEWERLLGNLSIKTKRSTEAREWRKKLQDEERNCIAHAGLASWLFFKTNTLDSLFHPFPARTPRGCRASACP